MRALRFQLHRILLLLQYLLSMLMLDQHQIQNMLPVADLKLQTVKQPRRDLLTFVSLFLSFLETYLDVNAFKQPF
jgi:hypothetical protein